MDELKDSHGLKALLGANKGCPFNHVTQNKQQSNIVKYHLVLTKKIAINDIITTLAEPR